MVLMASHSGKVVWKSKKSTVIDCKKCGFYHVNPIPKLDVL